MSSFLNPSELLLLLHLQMIRYVLKYFNLEFRQPVFQVDSLIFLECHMKPLSTLLQIPVELA